LARRRIGSALALLSLASSGIAVAQEVLPATRAWLNPVVTHPASDNNPLVKSLLDTYEPQGWTKYIVMSVTTGRIPPELRGSIPGPVDQFELHEGKYKGSWQLLNPRHQSLPTVAIRMQVRDTMPYRVDVEVFCQKTDCGTADAFVAKLRAPAPSRGQDAALSKSIYSEWGDIVSTESCSLGAKHTEAPPYPQSELSKNASGTVTLGLFANRCGEVRDSWVVTSSGNEKIDRSAVDTARKWRIDTLPDGKAGTANVSISFFPDQPSPPASSASSK
jgi:TonB family protein